MDIERFREAKFLEFISELASEESNARALLESVGFPRNRMPSFGNGTPIDFWRAATTEIHAGATEGGLGALLARAAERWPHNQQLAPYRSQEARGTARPSTTGVSLIAEDYTGDALAIFDRAQEYAREAGGIGRVELDFAVQGVVALHLEDASTEDALLVVRRLQENEEATVSVAGDGYRDYLLHQVFVEGPDQRRFELRNVPASTLVADVTESTMHHYEDEAWPIDTSGTPREAVADVIRPGEPSRRLDGDQSLDDCGVREGETIQISPESTAGAVHAALRAQALVRVRNQIAEFATGRADFQVQANGRQSPTEFVLDFAAPSFAPPTGPGTPPVRIDRHKLLIQLRAGFPVEAPRVFWLTPIFHPNIDQKNGFVCLGELEDKYQPGLDFRHLCGQLLDIAQLRNYQTGEGLNRAAANWLKSEQGREAAASIGARVHEPSEDRSPKERRRARKLQVKDCY
ncbi:MAG: effector-associated domain EAD1-containing protein [Planctomycetota bacterium]